jgi:transposase
MLALWDCKSYHACIIGASTMNRLSIDARAKILHLLCEGMSIRAITRLTGVSKTTVSKLVVDVPKPAVQAPPG